MPKRTTTKPTKPAKPYADFPLFAHATKRWCKKIRGKFCYFGPWNDPDGALKRYLEQRDDLHAGRVPRADHDGLTLRDMCNRFLTAKLRKLEAGELRQRSFRDYRLTVDILVGLLDRNRLVDDLTADDFSHLRAKLAKTRGPVALGNQVQRIRTICKYAFDAGLIDTPLRFGPEFVKPGRKAIRRARQGQPPKLFTAAEIRRLLDISSVPLKAMVLLGVNCGLGNSDVAELPVKALDLRRAMLDYPRPKTMVERRCPLWPETVEALQNAIRSRPKPKDKADAGLVFVTKYGHRWVRVNTEKYNPIDSVRLEFEKLLRELKIKRTGNGFYTLRHVFETVAGQALDQPAVDRCMGHERPDMASVYRQWTSDKAEDKRLKKVTDHVHAWLFGE